MTFLIYIIGYVLLYMACDYKRTEESKIPFLSKEYFIQVGMVMLGGTLLVFGTLI